MKKNKKKPASPAKGELTQEMDAMLEAASAHTAEIGIILDSQKDVSSTGPDAETVDVSRETSETVEETTMEASAPSDATAQADAPAEETVSSAAQPANDEEPTAASEDAVSSAPDDGPTALLSDASPDISTDTEPSEDYKKLGLYLHVPFCKSKCAYCDFYSIDKTVCAGRKIPDEMTFYVKALKNHMQILSERTTQYNVDTVFIGGGTPTALPSKLLLDIVKAVDDCFYLDEDAEFTVEMNPATADEKLLKKLRRAGVNRLSIGLQSAHNHELAALSRIHTTGDFAESFQMAREAGFENINIDVMYGIPEQTKDSFMETLAFVVSMKPEHISMYNLRIEDGTPLGEKKHMLPLPDEDTECDMYFEGIEYLKSHGYHQYEISNFARDGKECRHNLRYWLGEEYLGCGPAAHSYFGGSRFSLKRSLAAYCTALAHKGKSIPASLLDENYKIDKKEEVAEFLMLRLRLTQGISCTEFKEKFGADFDAVFGKKLQVYIDRGFMTHEGDRYAFTPQGMFVSNFILSRIIPFEPKAKTF